MRRLAQRCEKLEPDENKKRPSQRFKQWSIVLSDRHGERSSMPTLPEQISTHWMVLGLALFFLKQWVADFLLQTAWMAKGKEGAVGWSLPLAIHVTIHGLATLLITLAIAPGLAWLALIDVVIHGVIDRSKARIQLRMTMTPDRSCFWWLLGIDQTLHHLTHLGFVIVIAATKTASLAI